MCWKSSLHSRGPQSASSNRTVLPVHSSPLVCATHAHATSEGAWRASTRMTICSSRPANPKRNSPPSAAEPVTTVVHQWRGPSTVPTASNTRSRAAPMASCRAYITRLARQARRADLHCVVYLADADDLAVGNGEVLGDAQRPNGSRREVVQQHRLVAVAQHRKQLDPRHHGREAGQRGGERLGRRIVIDRHLDGKGVGEQGGRPGQVLARPGVVISANDRGGVVWHPAGPFAGSRVHRLAGSPADQFTSEDLYKLLAHACTSQHL